jgi:TetR/AcrR family transcriptional regulator, cholesterol catabolism regulator
MNEVRLPRRQRAEARRVQLIDTALEVFAAKGFDAATVKDLSEAAGVAEGLLYHYFRSKEDLLRAALERLWGAQTRFVDSEGGRVG